MVIAKRMLGSELGDITVEMDAPVPDGADFRCVFRIAGPLTQGSFHAFGVDAFQALQLALDRLAIELRHSPEFTAGPIRWLDLAEPGFRMPETLADLGWRRPDADGAAP